MKAVKLALSSSCISTALSWRTHDISGQVLSSQNMLSRDLGSRVLTGAAAPAERLSSPRTVKYYIHSRSRSFGVMVLMLGAFTQHPGEGDRQQTQRVCRITHCLSENAEPTPFAQQPLHHFAPYSGLLPVCRPPRLFSSLSCQRAIAHIASSPECSACLMSLCFPKS